MRINACHSSYEASEIDFFKQPKLYEDDAVDNESLAMNKRLEYDLTRM